MQCLSTRLKMVFSVVVLTLFLSSCVSHKDLILLNEGEEISEGMLSDTLVGMAQKNAFQPYRIQPYDQLMIRVNAFDGSTEDFLNREFSGGGGTGRRPDFDPASVFFNSYSVNDSGYVILPILEEVDVAGKTLAEIKSLLDQAYTPYIKFVSSNIKLANPLVTVLGEVQSPGIHYMYNEQNSILDAIGLAGDFTEFSDRRKVKVIRRTKKGTKTVYLNMNRSDFMNTEYYYAQPHDVIYVEPKKAKAFDSSAKSVGVVISAVSLAALFANLIIDFARN